MEEKQTKVLVTGGAGYIGSVLIGQLLQSNYRVTTIDNLSFGGNALLAYLSHPYFEFIKGDVCFKKDLAEALKNIDAVIHLAAIVGDPACKINPELAQQVNKEGAELLCQMSLENGVRRFIFASTCSNYGKMPDPHGYVNETTPLNPVSLYAHLKVDFEKYLMSNANDTFAPVCLRFATAYGLSPRPRFDLTVNEFTHELVLGKKLDIYGERFWRPYCHVTDIARACVLALEADRSVVVTQTFNVGDNEENYQKKTLIKMILKELPHRKNLVSYITRDEDPRDYRVNFDKIKKTLGFSVRKSVPDGIREIIFAIESGLIKNPQDKIYQNV